MSILKGLILAGSAAFFVGCEEKAAAKPPTAPATTSNVTYKCAKCQKTQTLASTASAPSC